MSLLVGHGTCCSSKFGICLAIHSGNSAHQLVSIGPQIANSMRPCLHSQIKLPGQGRGVASHEGAKTSNKQLSNQLLSSSLIRSIVVHVMQHQKRKYRKRHEKYVHAESIRATKHQQGVRRSKDTRAESASASKETSRKTSPERQAATKSASPRMRMKTRGETSSDKDRFVKHFEAQAGRQVGRQGVTRPSQQRKQGDK